MNYLEKKPENVRAKGWFEGQNYRVSVWLVNE